VSNLPPGHHDELAVRLENCHSMLRSEFTLPHGYQDELAVRLAHCPDISPCVNQALVLADVP
jgi:hypothetical protein